MPALTKKLCEIYSSGQSIIRYTLITLCLSLLELHLTHESLVINNINDKKKDAKWYGSRHKGSFKLRLTPNLSV